MFALMRHYYGREFALRWAALRPRRIQPVIELAKQKMKGGE